MNKERGHIWENPLVKGGLVFVGVMILAGISINLIGEVAALAE